MALTALDVQQQSFGTSRHGYDPQEVDIFLEKVADEVDYFNRALLEAKNRYEGAEARVQAAEQRIAELQTAGPQVIEKQVVAKAAVSTVTEDQIARAFIAAQRSADAMKDEARVEVEKAYREAEQRARDIVRDAMSEKQRILVEIERLRSSCEKFRSEYLSLLNHFSADAKKAMPMIDAVMPDASKAKASNEGLDFTAQNDAAFAPPQATASKDEEDVSYADYSGVDELQGVIDLDDDLDIEEID